jgi:NAD(P)-dependent dehydrogenase (short-subunit alcohol dehydrogenase family)
MLVPEAAMDLGLDGKVAIVTGGARGIGRGIATVLHAEGARVVVADVDRDGAVATAKDLGLAGAYGCDVRVEEQVRSLVDAVAVEHGGLDIVVSNAGICSLSPVTQMPYGLWRDLMAVNLDGTFLVLKYAGGYLAGHGGGAIVVVASIAGWKGWPGVGHYAASKAAVLSLVQTVALELKPAGVRVNAVCPGMIDTQLAMDMVADYGTVLGVVDAETLLVGRQGRYGRPEEIGDVVAFLASERAELVSGSAYVVDSALTAGQL